MRGERFTAWGLAMAQMGFFDLSVKWSGKLGHCAKMYPTRMNGYENDEATELFGQV